MSRQLPDNMIDARLIDYLHDRAELGAARARSSEQVADEIMTRLRPSNRVRLEPVRVRRLVLLFAVVALVLALLASWLVGSRLPSVLPAQAVTIAIELPIGGDDPVAAPIVNGIMMAVADASGRAGRFRIETPQSSILSDVVDGQPDAAKGAANMRQLAGDSGVVAVIGPYHSSVALQELPISRAAGLMQCSPANTNPLLTRTADGETQPAASPTPAPANFVRVVTTDDIAAAAAARYLFERLGRTSVYVIDNAEDQGRGMADWFEAEFARLGGTVVSRASLPDSAAELSAMLVSARARDPQAIYFGGSGEQGATVLRAAMAAGLAEIPFVGTDALDDGGAAMPGSFLDLVGEGARHAYSVVPRSTAAGMDDFEARYRARYGTEPTPYAAAGYACAQVVIAALRRVDGTLPAGPANLRDAVRAAGVDTAETFETIIGPIAFDERGDVRRPLSAIYTYDASAHDWVYVDQIGVGTGAGN